MDWLDRTIAVLLVCAICTHVNFAKLKSALWTKLHERTTAGKTSTGVSDSAVGARELADPKDTKSELTESGCGTEPKYGECSLCPWSKCNPALDRLCDYSPDRDVTTLRSVLGSIAADRMKLAELLTQRSDDEKKQIADKISEYKLKTKVEDKIMSVTGHRFKDFMVALATPLHDYYADQLYIVVNVLQKRLSDHGLGVSSENKQEARKIMVEMLTTITPCFMQKINQSYKQQYGAVLQTSVGASLREPQMSFGLTNRPPAEHMYIQVIKSLIGRKEYSTKDLPMLTSLKKDATIYEKKQFLTRMYTELSMPQIKDAIDNYGKENFKSLLHQDMFGDEIHGTITDIALNQQKYFADQIEIALSETPVNYDRFTHIIRSRASVDLRDIKVEYQKKYGKTVMEKFTEGFPIESERKHYYEAVESILKGKRD